jgi:hypothetical protein
MRPASFIVLVPLFVSCSDYGFSDGEHVWPGDDTSTPEADADTDADTDSEEPPPEIIEDCDPDTQASFEGGEIYVKSWDMTSASGTISATDAGWYHLYDHSLAESGASQTNEVSYLRIRNSRRPDGEPYWENCAGEWFVADLDNSGSVEGLRFYAGTFWLEPGANDLELLHYCPVERSGYCPQFHDTSDSGSTCDSDGPNSVHFSGSGLCLRRVDLPEP